MSKVVYCNTAVIIVTCMALLLQRRMCCCILQFILLVLPGCDLQLSQQCDMPFQTPPSHNVCNGYSILLIKKGCTDAFTCQGQRRSINALSHE